MAAASALPIFLQKKELPANCHSQLIALHKQYLFTEDIVEAFEVNSGSLSAEKLADFETFISREVARAAAKPAAAATTAAGLSGRAGARGSKRVRAFLDLAGASPAAPAVAEVAAEAASPDVASPAKPTTPGPKRGRQAEDLVMTPESVRKAAEVSLKSSLNDKLAVTGGAPAAPAKIDVLGDSALWTGPRGGAYTWMDESLVERAADRDRRLADAEPGLLQAMRAKHPEIEDLILGVVGVPAQAEVVLCGRILCEGLEGRLNERSMLLEGSRASSQGARVQLNVSGCPQVAAFPGQVVAVLGRSGTTGTTFHARDVVAGFGVPRAPVVPLPSGSSGLRALIFAGPFCTFQNLDYSPLQKALDHAVQVRPEVVLIMGPLVDSNNRMISSGDLSLPGGRTQDDIGLDEVYTGHVLPMLRKGISELKRVSPNTEVLLVPSLDDVLNFHPMPQPSFDVSLGSGVGDGSMDPLRKLGVRFLPNPAHLSVDGLKISVTSADALSPLLRSGLVLRPEDRKIEQALRALLEQRSLFPVLPRDPPQVCEARASALNFPEDEVPDLCIFPSVSGTASAQFVDGRLFINPGTVCRAAAMGSFAELFVASGYGSKGPLSENARVDIKSFAIARR